MKTPTIEITIDGPPGSGKTQLLNHLSELLKKNPFWMKGRGTPELVLRTHPLGEAPVVIEPPAPAAIPLGDNVTRSGLRARVLANDLPDDRFPVGYSLPNGSLVKTNRAGSYLNSETKHDLDLVGHRHHEIKAPEDTELEDLRRWKTKMSPILAALNLPEIAKEIGETGAVDTAREILPYIVELKAKLEKAKGGLTPAERNEAGSLLDAVKHCWSQLPADLAFNDLLMRRTAPRDWTPENLKLAKRANHHLNEL